MLNYLIKRLLGLIPLLIGITLISFAVIHLAPGKPTDALTNLNPKISLDARAKLNRLYELDKPIFIQYKNWLKRFVRLDFGESFIDARKVIDKIKERLPITLFINIVSIILILLIGIPLGIIGSTKQGSFTDKSITAFVFIGFAMPSFWLALILMDIFCIKLGWLPVLGMTSLDFESFNLIEKIIDLSRHLALPIFIFVFGGLAGISRYMRQSMIQTLNKPYILTARAKGLSQKVIIYKHALRNSLLPIITLLGLSIPGLISGSVIIESVFAIPGMGRLFFESVMSRDYPVIMGILTIGAILTMLGNLLADICYAYADPRIRYSKQ
ncbi:MAG: ABC transporter permease [Candidatus Omnitrophica bacterium]|nr:ABC transporter permease [Candidatus Omnitrophota bacterium]MDD5352349.1 ABC transporter permease [Candidatus Omnitrophota bacterium]MDD5549947.1 ABC transporter permease [Candidatus Omnitrophota bacterium]